MKADVVIVGSGAAGLFAALHLPPDLKVIIITKEKAEICDSFLAQGGICVLKDEDDYESYFEDTMRAGHYENRRESVDIMIRSSREIIGELIDFGVDFQKENGELSYTREGAHSASRILFHKDITGKEITEKLLFNVRKRPNVTILEDVTLIDVLEEKNRCYGVVVKNPGDDISCIECPMTLLATGGIGGIYDHSTNYPHLTGDAIAIALRHGIEIENINYVQIHPTTLYTGKKGRCFLISESVRGEGAVLLNADMERFVDELLPRDVVTEAIYNQMKKDNKPHVWLSMKNISEKELREHFPNIYLRCRQEGYDVPGECIPVVPSQHYFMGGIRVDLDSKTSMEGLYAAGETSCNGVHGKNRLASNSLLEALVFAKRAAIKIVEELNEIKEREAKKDKTGDIKNASQGMKLKGVYSRLADKALNTYKNVDMTELEESNKKAIWEEIEKENKLSDK